MSQLMDRPRMIDQLSPKNPANPQKSDVAAGLLPRSARRALPLILLKAREAMMSHFRLMLSQHSLTEQQWRVLRALAQFGESDAGELAERSFILSPSLTRILRTLEERGVIERDRDRRDARRVLLTLSQKGLALLNQVRPESQKIYDQIEERFGIEKVEQLATLLEELTEASASVGRDRATSK